MDISPIFFYIFAGAAILCALMVILNRNPASSAFSLVLTFFCFAGIYGMLGAHLVAALQVLVYAGAIMVLFVFVIMLLGEDQPRFDSARTPMVVKALAALIGLLLFGMFAWVFKASPISGTPGAFTQEAIEAAGGNTRVVSELMFSEYILPFELTSVLLLAAIVGAVAIAKRKAPATGPTIVKGGSTSKSGGAIAAGRA